MTAAAGLRQEPEDTDRALFNVIKERSVRYGKFKLASGAESNLYFNLKTTMMSPRGAYLCAIAFLKRAKECRADFVGGIEMGAVPVLGALAAISEAEGMCVKTFFVRKKVKAHGTMDLIEGLSADESLRGANVLVVDDVASTGGSILEAIKAAREAGATVADALVLVDRNLGGRENLAAAGVRLISVFREQDFC